MKNFKILLLFLTLFVYSCTSVQHISKMNVTYDVLSTQTNAKTDDAIHDIVEPYKSQLDEKMNKVIANVGTELTKKQPESTLGNWTADALMAGAQRIGLAADFALCNYGGMRVQAITPGPLTVGEVYELSPFDNAIMVVDMPGNFVDTLLQFIAVRNGWPISGNIRMTIKDGVMKSCLINGKAIDDKIIYKVVMPDYVANGGDDARFMIGLTRLQTGLIQRDLILQFAAETAAMGKDINVSIEGRIVKEK